MTLIERMLLSATAPAAVFGYPVTLEKLEIDPNTSLWASYTPDYRPTPPLTEDTTADLAIIGGGFTGVSTAYHFSQRYPQKRVVLLEAKALANGASGRNGGMVLNWMNGLDDPDDDLTRRIYHTTRAAIDMIEGIITEHHLPVSYRRDGSLEVLTTAQRAETAHAEVERMQALGLPLRYLDKSALSHTINLNGAHGAILDPTAGQMNGAQFIRALRPILLERGVAIYEGTPVHKLEGGSTIRLVTPHAEVKAKAIVIATNGYTGKLGLFRKALFPLHSHVFATEPLTPDQQKAIGWYRASGYSDDYDRVSYSVITPEGHLVFGGGSNASYDYLFNNRTAYPHDAARSFATMQQTLTNYLPATQPLRITHKWTGTLGISLSRNCSMGVIGPDRNIYYALGYSGHGVTLANLAGKVLTDIYSGDDHQWRDLPFYHAPFAPIPLEPFRWIGYQLMTRLTGRSPRLHQR